MFHAGLHVFPTSRTQLSPAEGNFQVNDRWRKALECLVRILLAVTILVYFVPFAPLMPRGGLDSSWVLAMGHAVGQRLVPGRDIAFTFGPYAGIYTRAFNPLDNLYVVLGATYLALCYIAALFTVMRRNELGLQIALVVALSTAFYTRDALLFSYPLLLAILCYRLVGPQPRLLMPNLDKRGGALLLALLASPLGLLPLIKGSMTLVCVGTLCLELLLFVSLRRLRLAAMLLVAVVLSMVIFWTLAEDSLGTLPRYLTSMSPIVAGYSEAMQNDGPANEWLLYLIGSLLVLLVIHRATRLSQHSGAFIILAYAFLLFVTFKAGFVRQQGHSIVASETLLLATLFLSCVIPSKAFGPVLVSSLLIWIYIDGNTFNLSTKGLLSNPVKFYSDAYDGLKQRLIDSGSLRQEFDAAMTAVQETGKLQKLEGSTDVYPWDQAYLIAAGDHWDPRPAFQSYAAYTSSLELANRAHLLGPVAPDHIMFRVDTIDGRLPALDDGVSWPVLLSHYEPEQFKNHFLYLKRSDSPNLDMARVEQTVSTSVQRLGRDVMVPSIEAPIMVRLSFKHRLLGSLMNLLFKPAKLSIEIRLEDGDRKNFRIISSMAEAGFLISPFVETTEDFAHLYGGMGYLPGHRVKSFSVSVPDGKLQWNSDYQVVFQKLNLPWIPDEGILFPWNRPIDVAATTKISNRAKCDGNIDSIKGMSADSHGDILNVTGWAAQSAREGLLPQRVLVALEDDRGARVFYSSTPSPRPDVALYFDRRALLESGIGANIDIKMLKGRFKIGLALENDGQIEVCPFKRIGVH